MSLSSHKLTAEEIYLQILNLQFFIITECLHHTDLLNHLLTPCVFLKNQIKISASSSWRFVPQARYKDPTERCY